MGLTVDAVIFGLAYLNGPKATLSFGGAGAKMRITDRAREALDCLIAEGFAVLSEPTDSIVGREHYRGTGQLWAVAKEMKIDPFNPAHTWPTFAASEATHD